MKTLFVALFISCLLSISIYAQRYKANDNHQHLTHKEIQRMDKGLVKYKAKKRNFNNENEFIYRSRYLSKNSYQTHYNYIHGYHYTRIDTGKLTISINNVDLVSGKEDGS